MKIQVAIDRVSLTEARRLVGEFNSADIVELGTSLTKDYGLESVTSIKEMKGNSKLLVDIKTIDEGEYEFRQYFNAGADILTVMGASAKETLDICYQVTEEYGKEMLIDLLECSDEKIQTISNYENAIYAMHFAKDSKRQISVVEEVGRFSERFPQIRRMAVAGSLNLDKVLKLKESNMEICIVGSSITKSEDPKRELMKFMEAVR
jgi:3-hexulose-6-phosphate synthase